MRKFKNIVFALFCLAMVVLAVASLLDNVTGVPGTSEAVYHSAPFAAMWGVLAVLALIYIFRRKLWKIPATLLIHVAFVVILAGALVTHLYGEQGRMHLRETESSNFYVGENGYVKQLSFAVQLNRFEVEYYPDSYAPKDYISEITFKDGGKEEAITISMNNIATHDHYRFYQSGYDDDLHGSILIVTRDPGALASPTLATYCCFLACCSSGCNQTASIAGSSRSGRLTDRLLQRVSCDGCHISRSSWC